MTTTIATAGTSATQSVTKSAAASIISSLDGGSGIDTDALVKNLVEAQFAAKNAQLTARLDTLTSQISGVSTLKSTITDFAKAFENLVKGGTLSAQPVSSNAGVLSATALSGARLAGLSASVRVDRLASAQTAVSTAFAARTETVGTGQLTLRLGTASFDAGGAMTALAPGAGDPITIDITEANGSLDGIAAAINAEKAGVTASVVTNVDGTAYLALKGATGAAQAFTLEATSTTGDLSRVAVGPGAGGMAVTGQAKNAQLTVDGIAVERASNTIDDLVSGVKLNLTATSPVAVTLTASTPTDALTQAVNDFVDTYNQVMTVIKEQTDPVTGVLRGDAGAKALVSGLKALTLKPLSAATDGSPTTLAELGVGTTRDGSLSLDAERLAQALADHPDAVEAMFSASVSGSTSLYAAMNSLQLNATSTLYGLGASTTRYNGARSDTLEAQDKVSEQAEKMTTRLTKQFASMNAAVSAYKSTQAFMQQQIDAWTKSD